MVLVRKYIAVLLIINHMMVTFIPLLYSPSLRAGTQYELSDNIEIIRSKLTDKPSTPSLSTIADRAKELAPPLIPKEEFLFASSSIVMPDSGKEIQPASLLPDLPSASSTDSPVISAQTVQSGLHSFWGVMGSNNPGESGMNMATSMASGLANNEIRDWLSHKGNARLELSTKGKSQGQILLPLWESDRNLAFSQFGALNQTDRSLYHIGAGWRHYLSNTWMLGINSFWDYDDTGSNARLGVGAEVWSDNLKFAANGYFRLTDWHQSPLTSMRDYDERPANGFDIRTETWFRSLPQLSATLKYEKYYGEGIALKDNVSPQNLANSPHAWTAGLRYTPFPLITVSAEHTQGSVSESQLKMSLNYRFGQSWKELTDSRLVQTARSLAGQRYDFVERNYDMVMQYKKQELLNLTLPDTIAAEALSMAALNASVHSKYGVKDIQWNTQELLLAGGQVVKQSNSSLILTMPPYYENGVNRYTVTAVVTDIHNNVSAEKRTTVIVSRSSNTVVLTATPSSNLITSGADVTTATATVTDSAGQPLAQMNVTFTLSGSDGSCWLTGSSTCQTLAITDGQGKATVRVGHTAAGTQTLQATLDNGNSTSQALHFIADSATARVESLTVTTKGGIANGTTTENLIVTVVDKSGNPVADTLVTLSASAGPWLSAGNVITDSTGKASFSAFSQLAGIFQITASANGTSASADVTFRADPGTARIASGALTILVNNALANNSDANQVQAEVTDAWGNPVSGVEVDFSAASHSVVTPERAITDHNGTALAMVTSTQAGVNVITATVNNSQAVANLTFTADTSTAQVALLVDQNLALANGQATNHVTATVTDFWGNPLANIAVSFNADNGANILSPVLTGADGRVSTTLTSTVAGNSLVTATLDNGHTQSTVVRFIADASTAEILSGNILVTANYATANGLAQNSVQVIVTDAHNNPVPEVAVTFSADQSTVVVPATAITDSSGLANTTLTSTLAGDSLVTATINGSSASITVQFVADPSTISIAAGSLRIISDNAAANGTATNEVEVRVTDAHDNPLADIAITFSADNGAMINAESVTTDANGLSRITLTSTTAGTSRVTAALYGSSENIAVTFVADTATAALSELVVISNDALADGIRNNSVRATVQDAHGNPVSGIAIVFSTDNGAIITASSALTDANGQIVATLAHTLAGQTQVTAEADSSSRSVVVNFIADAASASLQNLEITIDNAVANGFAANGVLATVTDAYGNPVAGVIVTFNADNGANIITDTGITDANGQTSATLTSTIAGRSTITATANGHSKNIVVNFSPDASTANLSASDLLVIVDQASANGVDENIVQATVKDAYGNPVSGVTVNWSAGNNATIVPANGITNEEGRAIANLTSTVAGIAIVTAAITGSDASVSTHFLAGNLVVDSSSLVVSPAAIPADGTTEATLRLTLFDEFGNAVTELSDLMFVALPAEVNISSPVEISEGVYVATLKSTHPGMVQIAATLGGNATGITGSLNIYPLSFSGRVTFLTP